MLRDEVTVNMDLTFDSANTGSVILKKSAGGVLEKWVLRRHYFRIMEDEHT